MGFYTLRVHVDAKGIWASEWKYDEECKYCCTFDTWAEMLEVHSKWMDSYTTIMITHDEVIKWH